ncbi:MAG: cobyric acid synthase [Candidatus Hydrothermarchaeaceae archaeon]
MPSIMVQGTASYAGKSFLVMALCRIFRDKGINVAPFKSQNMSLNSYVTKDGKEIARAQTLQAFAAGVEPSVEMNPILIKPMGESKSQIVVNGKPYKDINAADYYKDFALKEGLEIARGAFESLERRHDLIIIEGAGSPAEINLYHQDIANMRIADMTDAPVVLVADIDKGGVFASIYGTLALLKEEHRDRIKGIVINKFRGDIDILKPGVEEIEQLTKKPVFGVIPYIEGLKLPEEDSVSLQDVRENRGKVEIAVIRLPRISNFTDFDPLLNDGVNVRYIDEPEALRSADAVIIPGTKNTIGDLEWLRERGFEESIRALRGKVPIVGICGGYQMLGNSVADGSRKVRGLGLLDVETRFEGYDKTTQQVSGRVAAASGIFEGMAGSAVHGYEIHMGKTALGNGATAVFELEDGRDGAIDADGMVFGTYLHGIFDSPSFRERFLRFVGSGMGTGSKEQEEIWNESVDVAARVVSNSIDIAKLEEYLHA